MGVYMLDVAWSVLSNLKSGFANVFYSLQNQAELTMCRTTRTWLPVVSGDSFLEVMEVALGGLIIICLLWERVVVEAASG